MSNSFCKKTIIIIFTLFLVVANAKNMDTPIPITFQGNKYIETSSLEEVVGAKRESPLLVINQGIATINEIYIPKLDEIFRLYYKKEGFYNANISHKIDNKGIHFFIKENRYIKVKSIKITTDFNIDELIEIKKGTRFRAELFTDTKLAIKKRLLENGYCNYDLNTKAYIDLKKYSTNIVIKLKKGNICHFGKINIKGSGGIDDKIIKSRLGFKTGDRFNIEKIKDSYTALYALEAFDQVYIKEENQIINKEKLKQQYDSLSKLKSFDEIYKELNKKQSNNIPMDIKYKEIKNRIHSRVGIGYATDLLFQTKYHWEYKNFYGNARKLMFDVLYSQKQKKLENNFLNPAIMVLGDYHLDFQNSAGYTQEKDIHNFDEKIAYDKFYLLHQDSEWFSSIGMGIENRDISNDRSFFLIYPFIKLVYDLRDSKINPTKGLYFSHEMEYGLPYSPDSTTYLKYIDELRLIYTQWGVTLSGVGRIGAIEEYQNRLPQSKKFFAGGAFSNRAYGYDKIGVISSTKDTQANEGGYNMANISLELNFPIYKNLQLGLFSDNTMIGSQQGIWEFTNDIIYSAGFGFRYMTPIGPFKLDFGFNTHKYSENAIHFQVGQSF
jgi:translocation and assembly module TamA